MLASREGLVITDDLRELVHSKVAFSGSVNLLDVVLITYHCSLRSPPRAIIIGTAIAVSDCLWTDGPSIHHHLFSSHRLANTGRKIIRVNRRRSLLSFDAQVRELFTE